jgi:hypothetical protein
VHDSYWIEAAESPLRDFRSSEELPQETDVVIIGSGYAGAATAYWMHKVSHTIHPEPEHITLADHIFSTRKMQMSNPRW